ncbi:hypothetical protein FJT64_005950 [Amphibalanus amphitrite]|uniref:Uncharacterized protein n=1 Tax=Amphibalanus amphitrite TaxID=1232801 RepID=A0A6A4VZ33_AMPAM|nr:hypothetical protein FJT64_005949 [Amphibalanus amphitrite]KAF0296621.1 hypothetical protein FJT64_005950 [Amphibalanus amphitrite]
MAMTIDQLTTFRYILVGIFCFNTLALLLVIFFLDDLYWMFSINIIIYLVLVLGVYILATLLRRRLLEEARGAPAATVVIHVPRGGRRPGAAPRGLVARPADLPPAYSSTGGAAGSDPPPPYSAVGPWTTQQSGVYGPSGVHGQSGGPRTADGWSLHRQ